MKVLSTTEIQAVSGAGKAQDFYLNLTATCFLMPSPS